MSIRKLFMSAIVAVMTLAAATCFAQISLSDLEINGIYIGQPISEVFNKLGEPTKILHYDNSIVQYQYAANGGGNFSVTPTADGQNVQSMGVLKSRGFVTKAGIGIGSSLANIKAVYGEPNHSAPFRSANGIVNTTHFYYSDSGDYRCSLTFVVEESSGTVCSFSCARNPNFYGNGSKSQTQAKQKPAKPKSTIPDTVTQVPASELNLGWIEPGQPMSKVEEVYGKPGKIDDQGFFQTYNYNDKFIVKGKMSNGYKVTSVASYEKGIKTPSGFMVGDAYSAVVKKFGKVNGVKFKGEELEATMKNLKGCTDYTYFSGKKQMVFLVDKKGIVQAIRVEDYDEQKFIETRRKK